MASILVLSKNKHKVLGIDKNGIKERKVLNANSEMERFLNF